MDTASARTTAITIATLKWIRNSAIVSVDEVDDDDGDDDENDER
jgi:hypothetical protein